VQSAHALAQFATDFPRQFHNWTTISNYLVCLETNSLWGLQIILEEYYSEIKYAVFREPDVGNKITALAVECIPDKLHKELFSKLKLTCYESQRQRSI